MLLLELWGPALQPEGWDDPERAHGHPRRGPRAEVEASPVSRVCRDLGTGARRRHPALRGAGPLERHEPRARRLEARVDDAAALQAEPLRGLRGHLGDHRADAHAHAVSNLEDRADLAAQDVERRVVRRLARNPDLPGIDDDTDVALGFVGRVEALAARELHLCQITHA